MLFCLSVWSCFDNLYCNKRYRNKGVLTWWLLSSLHYNRGCRLLHSDEGLWRQTFILEQHALMIKLYWMQNEAWEEHGHWFSEFFAGAWVWNSKILKQDLIEIQVKLWIAADVRIMLECLIRGPFPQQQRCSQNCWTLFPFIPAPHTVYFGALLHHEALRHRRTKTWHMASNPVTRPKLREMTERRAGGWRKHAAFLKATVLWVSPTDVFYVK